MNGKVVTWKHQCCRAYRYVNVMTAEDEGKTLGGTSGREAKKIRLGRFSVRSRVSDDEGDSGRQGRPGGEKLSIGAAAEGLV